MGRIIAQVKITNFFDENKFIKCSMFVDTGAGALILPDEWKERFGNFRKSEPVELILANGETINGEICSPVEIEIEGFRPITNEVVFTKMEREKGENFEPLLGYIILEQSQASIDMLGHRLIPVKYIDMK